MGWEDDNAEEADLFIIDGFAIASVRAFGDWMMSEASR